MNNKTIKCIACGAFVIAVISVEYFGIYCKECGMHYKPLPEHPQEATKYILTPRISQLTASGTQSTSVAGVVPIHYEFKTFS